MVASILIMLVGAYSYSFWTGSMTSLIQDYDREEQAVKTKIKILNQIYKDHDLPLGLYQKVRQAILYDHRKGRNEAH